MRTKLQLQSSASVVPEEVTQLRLRFPVLVTAALFALISVACNSADKPARVTNASTPAQKTANSPQIPTVTADGIQRITTAELQEKLQKNEVVVIDVRTEASFNLSHIRGAKLIPHTEIAKRANELPRDKLIVTYCS